MTPVDLPVEESAAVMLSESAQIAGPIEEPSPPENKIPEEVEQLIQEMLKKAKAEANFICQAAEIEAMEIRSQAWQTGYNEGKNEAAEAFEMRMREGAESISALIGEISASYDRFFDAIEGEVIDLCLATAKKIVNVAIKKDDNIFESMIINALRQMKREGKISIRVSENQYNTFFSSGSATFVLGDESVNAAMIADPLQSDLDCIIESDGETINAGVDSQLKAIALAFGRSGDHAL